MKAGFEVEGVTFAYGEKIVLQDFSIRLPAGRFYGIVGPNGCGKSTLLDLLAGHQAAAAGRILFNGKSLGGIFPQGFVPGNIPGAPRISTSTFHSPPGKS